MYPCFILSSEKYLKGERQQPVQSPTNESMTEQQFETWVPDYPTQTQFLKSLPSLVTIRIDSYTGLHTGLQPVSCRLCCERAAISRTHLISLPLPNYRL